MDNFEYADAEKAPPARNNSALLWNILTALILLMVLCLGGFFLTVFVNPYIAINPFKPPVIPTLMKLPTITETPKPILPPTWTPGPTEEPTATNPPRPSSTPVPTNTPFSTPAGSPVPSVTPGGYSFVLQQGSPQAIANIFDPGAGCNWMGVGGQALDLSGAPLVGLIVKLGGTLEGKPVDFLGMSGTATQLGKGGFMFVLSDHPIASNQTLWVQLMDQLVSPLDKVPLDTFTECDKNLIVVYFKQAK